MTKWIPHKDLYRIIWLNLFYFIFEHVDLCLWTWLVLQKVLLVWKSQQVSPSWKSEWYLIIRCCFFLEKKMNIWLNYIKISKHTLHVPQSLLSHMTTMMIMIIIMIMMHRQANTMLQKCFRFGRFQWESIRFSIFEATWFNYNGYRVNCRHSCCLVIFWHRVKVMPVVRLAAGLAFSCVL